MFIRKEVNESSLVDKHEMCFVMNGLLGAMLEVLLSMLMLIGAT